MRVGVTGAPVLHLSGPVLPQARTNTARSAKCPGGIFAAAARWSRQYVWMVPGGWSPRTSRTRASWARESMAGAIVAEQPHVGQLGFRERDAQAPN